MNIPLLIVAVLVAYLIGSIPFGWLIGKYNGVDIRTVGSGNIGATNVTRSVGKLAGRLCFAADFLKGFLPTLFAHWLFPGHPGAVFGVAAATILGHMFPCYLKFRGGKGISTSAGAALAIVPYPLLVAVAAWLLFFGVTRYVSVGSIAAALALIAGVWLGRIFQIGSPVAQSLVSAIFCTVLGAVAIYRHRENIRRLCNGTENRFGKK